MNEFLKLAYEEGKEIAKEDLKAKLEEAVKKREALVGWKEQSVPPARLNKGAK